MKTVPTNIQHQREDRPTNELFIEQLENGGLVILNITDEELAVRESNKYFNQIGEPDSELLTHDDVFYFGDIRYKEQNEWGDSYYFWDKANTCRECGGEKP